MNHALRAAIELRRHALSERRDLRDAHVRLDPTSSPIRSRSVIVVDALVILARPGPVIVVGVFRGTVELVLSDIQSIPAQRGIVFESGPGRRIVVVTHT